jgi:hypothetical protein
MLTILVVAAAVQVLQVLLVQVVVTEALDQFGLLTELDVLVEVVVVELMGLTAVQEVVVLVL